MSAAPESVVFAAKRTFRFQKPPHQRPGGDAILLLRWFRDGDEPTTGWYGNVKGPNMWRFPYVGELEISADLAPWTDATHLARIDARFEPPGVDARDVQWIGLDFLRGIAPAVLHPHVPSALRRFDGPLLDQILARVEALADAIIHSGDIKLSSEVKRLERELAAAKQKAQVQYKRGEIHAIKTPDAAGRIITTYEGHNDACWDQFNPAPRYLDRQRPFLTRR